MKNQDKMNAALALYRKNRRRYWFKRTFNTVKDFFLKNSLAQFLQVVSVWLAGLFAILTFRGSIWRGRPPGRGSFEHAWIGKYYRVGIKRREFVCAYPKLTPVILHLGKIRLGKMSNPIRTTPPIDWKTANLDAVRPGRNTFDRRQRWNENGLYR